MLLRTEQKAGLRGEVVLNGVVREGCSKTVMFKLRPE